MSRRKTTSGGKENNNSAIIIVAIIGLIGTIATAFFAFLSSIRPIEIVIYTTETAVARLTQLATPVPTLTFSVTTSATQTRAIPSQTPDISLTLTKQTQKISTDWQSEKLIYENDFENKKKLDVLSGQFDIAESVGGNHVWRSIKSGASQIILPQNAIDYVVEANIMHVNGEKGFGSIQIRIINEKLCPIGYVAYLDFFEDWLKLTEYDKFTCDEVGESGVFSVYKISLSNGVWYKLRIAANDNEVRVFLDDYLVAQDVDTDGIVEKSNIVALGTCCSDLEPFTFYFDNIRIWSLEP